MEKRWNLLRPDEQVVSTLQKHLRIMPVLCRILVERGITSYKDAKQYFRPKLESLHDPFLMKDMDRAVDRINKAMASRERILVYGDYDVDGTTAVGCMYRFLGRIYDKQLLDFYIPHRYREGYGISKQGVDHAISQGFTLVIALDCGIKSQELIAYAKEQGVDFIVCDHHIPDHTLPPAAAILNPKQDNCHYPYKELCGCGVGFKLITALVQHRGLDQELYLECLDLTATAIAADIVPMTGENRVMAYFGLKKANESPSTALKALMEVSGMKGKVLIHHLVFMIAPRVNAAGRMDDARKVVDLFTETDFNRAIDYAKQLHLDNADRKEADVLITQEALTLIRESPEKRKSTVVYQPHWHKGVVGIVASRLIDHYYRPTIVLTRSGDVVAGSARSIPGFNIHDGLEQCKEYLLGFGGHYFAAGMTLKPEHVDAFSAKFDEVVDRLLKEHHFTPEIRIDAELNFTDCTRKLYDIITQMEPFGPENTQPVFVARHATDNGSKIVKDLHLRVVARQCGKELKGIGFNLASKYDIVGSGHPFDIVFTLEENEWQGQVSLQMKVIDVKPSETAG
jgi:single-stranded-DNA-specific exonuclease